MDQVEAMTADCLSLLEESLKAAEEDIAAYVQQKKAEDGKVVQEEYVKKKNSIAQDLLREEIDELKLIENDCNEDIKAIKKKLGELDAELMNVRMQRDNTQKLLNGKLEKNYSEQDQLRERLKQLEKEEKDLIAKVKQSNRFQAEADQDYKACKEQVRDIQNKIQKLLNMVNASIKLMKEITVQTASKEKSRVLKYLEQKELHCNLQLRDALMAKIVFHIIQMEEMSQNLQDTKKETAELNKELKSAAKSGNKHKVARLKEAIASFEGEENSYEGKKKHHEKEINILQERCKKVDRKLNETGITQLPTIDERVAKWKAEQDKCFDNPDTGEFYSNISQFQ